MGGAQSGDVEDSIDSIGAEPLGGSGGEGLMSDMDGSGSFISPEVREKIRRLEREVESLRSASATDGESKELLEGERAARVALELEVASLRAAAIAADVGGGGGGGGGGGTGGRSDLELQLKRTAEQLKEKSEENARHVAEKEKLEEYTKRALHSVQDKYMLAIKTCKAQLKDKDERINRVTDQYKQYKQTAQKEAQLLSSAIYELGMKISEKRLVRDLENSSTSTSISSSGVASAAKRRGP